MTVTPLRWAATDGAAQRTSEADATCQLPERTMCCVGDLPGVDLGEEAQEAHQPERRGLRAGTSERRAMRRPLRNLSRGQSQKLDERKPEHRKVYTTERPDGLLVARESRPVGFNQEAEEWDLNL
jgi:hypothetical protein